MSLSYVWEVFYTGTRGLATGEGRIQDRLANTFQHYLSHRLSTLLREGQITGEIAEKTRAILDRMARVPGKAGEGAIVATCHEMGDGEARAIAADLFDLFHEVRGLHAVEEYRQEQKYKKQASR